MMLFYNLFFERPSYNNCSIQVLTKSRLRQLVLFATELTVTVIIITTTIIIII